MSMPPDPSSPPADPQPAQPVAKAIRLDAGGIERAEHRLSVLLANAPPPGRAFAEAAFVIAALFAPTLLLAWLSQTQGSPVIAMISMIALYAVLGTVGVLLVAGPSVGRSGRFGRSVLIVGGLLLPVTAEIVVGLALHWSSTDAAMNAFLFELTAVRGVGLILIVAALLHANGQSPAQVGWVSKTLWIDVAVTPSVYLSAWGAIVVGGLPVLAYVVLTQDQDFVQQEMAQRRQTFTVVLPEVAVWRMAIAMLFVGFYEELVFRGFVLPRLRVVVGRWWLAVVIAAVLFSIGHLYQGVVPAYLTGVLAVYFSVVFLGYPRLLPIGLAHAAFNITQLLASRWLLDPDNPIMRAATQPAP